MYNELIQEKVKELLLSYKSAFFTNSIRTYIQCLPRTKLLSVLCATEEVLLTDGIPSRVAMLVRDLIAYRYQVHMTKHNDVGNGNVKNRGLLKVYFHNKGIDMIDLPAILNKRRVIATVPNYLGNVYPPILLI